MLAKGTANYPTEYVLTFKVEVHNGQLNMHTTRGTHVAAIGRKTPLMDFRSIEPHFLSEGASAQPWTHAFAIRNNTTVVGVWQREPGSTRCLGVLPMFAPYKILPYVNAPPLTGIVTGSYDRDASRLNQGADWARRQFKDDPTLGVAAIMHAGRLYMAWQRDNDDAKLIATGPRAILH